MIKSFTEKETEKLFDNRLSRKLPASIINSARRKLILLDAAETLQDLKNLPGNQLEKLSGNRVGQYSIRINDQWRICFEWKENNAFRVEITDYH